jgi:enoyl-[acyl-carrier-protein] reductase (NADH)
MKGIDVSAMSFHKMLAVARKLDAINEWGSVVALTYMAAQRVFPFYTDMADIKAMLESIARNLVTITDWRKKYALIPFHNRQPKPLQVRVSKVLAIF